MMALQSGRLHILMRRLNHEPILQHFQSIRRGELFPRLEFHCRVKELRAERHARGFTCWGQFVAMLFCQLGRAQSLREICDGLRSCEGKLTQLGIPAPKRSTLAYANEHRPWELYQGLFLDLFERCRQQCPSSKKFRFRNPPRRTQHRRDPD
jgi:hypothetical protein